uniref:Uncharacterized protein n=1 Tax=Chromera velia CCMP2878 TaxID=1169474 RepID=A0A0G4FFC5_9ALVE|eukprot:Cvel_16705.t1-p1 / transcript=Cvel_16705.t1 / gene=Cvel_16705 / organism=Chromera_velia_CCMP2878 / gene_product=hypothetical protein / transcript_product=hypothetical protein / location=Cvel_scaffold1297:26002-42770(-) / protein_length=4002 / sequence_SO=supercontig / SO=protein_coding / is_pseudo=false
MMWQTSEIASSPTTEECNGSSSVSASSTALMATPKEAYRLPHIGTSFEMGAPTWQQQSGANGNLALPSASSSSSVLPNHAQTQERKLTPFPSAPRPPPPPPPPPLHSTAAAHSFPQPSHAQANPKAAPTHPRISYLPEVPLPTPLTSTSAPAKTSENTTIFNVNIAASAEAPQGESERETKGAKTMRGETKQPQKQASVLQTPSRPSTHDPASISAAAGAFEGWSVEAPPQPPAGVAPVSASSETNCKPAPSPASTGTPAVPAATPVRGGAVLFSRPTDLGNSSIWRYDAESEACLEQKLVETRRKLEEVMRANFQLQCENEGLHVDVLRMQEETNRLLRRDTQQQPPQGSTSQSVASVGGAEAGGVGRNAAGGVSVGVPDRSSSRTGGGNVQEEQEDRGGRETRDGFVAKWRMEADLWRRRHSALTREKNDIEREFRLKMDKIARLFELLTEEEEEQKQEKGKNHQQKQAAGVGGKESSHQHVFPFASTPATADASSRALGAGACPAAPPPPSSSSNEETGGSSSSLRGPHPGFPGADRSVAEGEHMIRDGEGEKEGGPRRVNRERRAPVPRILAVLKDALGPVFSDPRYKTGAVAVGSGGGGGSGNGGRKEKDIPSWVGQRAMLPIHGGLNLHYSQKGEGENFPLSEKKNECGDVAVVGEEEVRDGDSSCPNVNRTMVADESAAIKLLPPSPPSAVTVPSSGSATASSQECYRIASLEQHSASLSPAAPFSSDTPHTKSHASQTRKTSAGAAEIVAGAPNAAGASSQSPSPTHQYGHARLARQKTGDGDGEKGKDKEKERGASEEVSVSLRRALLNLRKKEIEDQEQKGTHGGEKDSSHMMTIGQRQHQQQQQSPLLQPPPSQGGLLGNPHPSQSSLRSLPKTRSMGSAMGSQGEEEVDELGLVRRKYEEVLKELRVTEESLNLHRRESLELRGAKEEAERMRNTASIAEKERDKALRRLAMLEEERMLLQGVQGGGVGGSDRPEHSVANAGSGSGFGGGGQGRAGGAGSLRWSAKHQSQQQQQQSTKQHQKERERNGATAGGAQSGGGPAEGSSDSRAPFLRVAELEAYIRQQAGVHAAEQAQSRREVEEARAEAEQEKKKAARVEETSRDEVARLRKELRSLHQISRSSHQQSQQQGPFGVGGGIALESGPRTAAAVAGADSVSFPAAEGDSQQKIRSSSSSLPPLLSLSSVPIATYEQLAQRYHNAESRISELEDYLKVEMPKLRTDKVMLEHEKRVLEARLAAVSPSPSLLMKEKAPATADAATDAVPLPGSWSCSSRADAETETERETDLPRGVERGTKEREVQTDSSHDEENLEAGKHGVGASNSLSSSSLLKHQRPGGMGGSDEAFSREEGEGERGGEGEGVGAGQVINNRHCPSQQPRGESFPSPATSAAANRKESAEGKDKQARLGALLIDQAAELERTRRYLGQLLAASQRRAEVAELACLQALRLSQQVCVEEASEENRDSGDDVQGVRGASCSEGKRVGRFTDVEGGHEEDVRDAGRMMSVSLSPNPSGSRAGQWSSQGTELVVPPSVSVTASGKTERERDEQGMALRENGRSVNGTLPPSIAIESLQDLKAAPGGEGEDGDIDPHSPEEEAEKGDAGGTGGRASARSGISSAAPTASTGPPQTPVGKQWGVSEGGLGGLLSRPCPPMQAEEEDSLPSSRVVRISVDTVEIEAAYTSQRKKRERETDTSLFQRTGAALENQTHNGDAVSLSIDSTESSATISLAAQTRTGTCTPSLDTPNGRLGEHRSLTGSPHDAEALVVNTEDRPPHDAQGRASPSQSESVDAEASRGVSASSHPSRTPRESSVHGGAGREKERRGGGRNSSSSLPLAQRLVMLLQPAVHTAALNARVMQRQTCTTCLGVHKQPHTHFLAPARLELPHTPAPDSYAQMSKSASAWTDEDSSCHAALHPDDLRARGGGDAIPLKGILSGDGSLEGDRGEKGNRGNDSWSNGCLGASDEQTAFRVAPSAPSSSGGMQSVSAPPEAESTNEPVAAGEGKESEADETAPPLSSSSALGGTVTPRRIEDGVHAGTEGPNRSLRLDDSALRTSIDLPPPSSTAGEGERERERGPRTARHPGTRPATPTPAAFTGASVPPSPLHSLSVCSHSPRLALSRSVSHASLVLPIDETLPSAGGPNPPGGPQGPRQTCQLGVGVGGSTGPGEVELGVAPAVAAAVGSWGGWPGYDHSTPCGGAASSSLDFGGHERGPCSVKPLHPAGRQRESKTAGCEEDTGAEGAPLPLSSSSSIPPGICSILPHPPCSSAAAGTAAAGAGLGNGLAFGVSSQGQQVPLAGEMTARSQEMTNDIENLRREVAYAVLDVEKRLRQEVKVASGALPLPLPLQQLQLPVQVPSLNSGAVEETDKREKRPQQLAKGGEDEAADCFVEEAEAPEAAESKRTTHHAVLLMRYFAFQLKAIYESFVKVPHLIKEVIDLSRKHASEVSRLVPQSLVAAAQRAASVARISEQRKAFHAELLNRQTKTLISLLSDVKRQLWLSRKVHARDISLKESRRERELEGEGVVGGDGTEDDSGRCTVKRVPSVGALEEEGDAHTAERAGLPLSASDPSFSLTLSAARRRQSEEAGGRLRQGVESEGEGKDSEKSSPVSVSVGSLKVGVGGAGQAEGPGGKKKKKLAAAEDLEEVCEAKRLADALRSALKDIMADSRERRPGGPARSAVSECEFEGEGEGEALGLPGVGVGAGGGVKERAEKLESGHEISALVSRVEELGADLRLWKEAAATAFKDCSADWLHTLQQQLLDAKLREFDARQALMIFKRQQARREREGEEREERNDAANTGGDVEGKGKQRARGRERGNSRGRESSRDSSYTAPPLSFRGGIRGPGPRLASPLGSHSTRPGPLRQSFPPPSPAASSVHEEDDSGLVPLDAGLVPSQRERERGLFMNGERDLARRRGGSSDLSSSDPPTMMMQSPRGSFDVCPPPSVEEGEGNFSHQRNNEKGVKRDPSGSPFDSSASAVSPSPALHIAPRRSSHSSRAFPSEVPLDSFSLLQLTHKLPTRHSSSSPSTTKEKELSRKGPPHASPVRDEGVDREERRGDRHYPEGSPPSRAVSAEAASTTRTVMMHQMDFTPRHQANTHLVHDPSGPPPSSNECSPPPAKFRPEPALLPFPSPSDPHSRRHLSSSSSACSNTDTQADAHQGQRRRACVDSTQADTAALSRSHPRATSSSSNSAYHQALATSPPLWSPPSNISMHGGNGDSFHPMHTAAGGSVHGGGEMDHRDPSQTTPTTSGGGSNLQGTIPSFPLTSFPAFPSTPTSSSSSSHLMRDTRGSYEGSAMRAGDRQREDSNLLRFPRERGRPSALQTDSFLHAPDSAAHAHRQGDGGMSLMNMNLTGTTTAVSSSLKPASLMSSGGGGLRSQRGRPAFMPSSSLRPIAESPLLKHHHSLSNSSSGHPSPSAAEMLPSPLYPPGGDSLARQMPIQPLLPGLPPPPLLSNPPSETGSPAPEPQAETETGDVPFPLHATHSWSRSTSGGGGSTGTVQRVPTPAPLDGNLGSPSVPCPPSPSHFATESGRQDAGANEVCPTCPPEDLSSSYSFPGSRGVSSDREREREGDYSTGPLLGPHPVPVPPAARAGGGASSVSSFRAAAVDPRGGGQSQGQPQMMMQQASQNGMMMHPLHNQPAGAAGPGPPAAPGGSMAGPMSWLALMQLQCMQMLQVSAAASASASQYHPHQGPIMLPESTSGGGGGVPFQHTHQQQQYGGGGNHPGMGGLTGLTPSRSGGPSPDRRDGCRGPSHLPSRHCPSTEAEGGNGEHHTMPMVSASPPIGMGGAAERERERESSQSPPIPPAAQSGVGGGRGPSDYRVPLHSAVSQPEAEAAAEMERRRKGSSLSFSSASARRQQSPLLPHHPSPPLVASAHSAPAPPFRQPEAVQLRERERKGHREKEKENLTDDPHKRSPPLETLGRDPTSSSSSSSTAAVRRRGRAPVDEEEEEEVAECVPRGRASQEEGTDTAAGLLSGLAAPSPSQHQRAPFP